MPQAAAAWVANAYFASAVAAGVSYATAVAVAAAIEVAVSFAASVAISYALSSALSKRPDYSGALDGRAINSTVRQAAAPRRLIYGEVKAGGVLAYPAQSTNGEYVWLVVYLGEGPIEAIDDVFWLGEDLSTETKFADLLTLEKRFGLPNQTAVTDVVTNSNGEWTDNDVGTGIAYAVVKYKWDRRAFPRGLVFPVFKVKGRKIYDPRTSTTAYSANPALIVLDLIRSEYGYAAPDEWIDFDSFNDAASICDEILNSLDTSNTVNGVAGKVRRYTFNGVLETSANPANLIEQVEKSCAGRLIFCGGKYRFYAGAWRSPSGTITAEYLRADPTFRASVGRQQLINTVRATYREPKQDWNTSEIPQIQLAQAVIEEQGEIVQSLDFPGVTVGAQAQRLARLAMNQARSAASVSLQCNYAAFQWKLYDTVTLDLPEIGASGVYLITSYQFAQGGGIDMTLIPHLASDFEWSTAYETIPAAVVRPNFNKIAPAITGLLANGAPVVSEEGVGPYSRLALTWDRSDFVRLKRYEVQYKKSSATVWPNEIYHSNSFFGPTGPLSNSWDVQNIEAEIEYDARVRSVSEDDEVGDWAYVNNTLVTFGAIPPGEPTNLSVTKSGSDHIISWTNPANQDFRKSIVWASSTNYVNTATQMAVVYGFPETSYSAKETPTGTRYYWVQSVDRSGLSSAKTYAGTQS